MIRSLTAAAVIAMTAGAGAAQAQERAETSTVTPLKVLPTAYSAGPAPTSLSTQTSPMTFPKLAPPSLDSRKPGHWPPMIRVGILGSATMARE